MKTLISILTILCTSTFIVHAQNEIDALHYSQTTSFGGTARSASMGGAFGALGADFSSLSINPAGVALYKKSEFTLTPVINGMHTSSDYMNTTQNDYRYSLGLNNIGMVFTGNTSKSLQDKGWMNIQFAFGMNKTNIFNSRTWINGFNPTNSIMDVYWQNAKGLSPSNLNDYDTGLAFDTYLLDTTNGSNVINFYSPSQGNVQQTKLITGKGAINEMVFTVGGNYKDKLYIGGTIGIPFLRYVEQSTYEEKDIQDTIFEFESLKIQDHIITKGTGLNFKFGMIYRPFDWLRLGGSFHSPTFFGLQDDFKRTITSSFDGSNIPEINGTHKSTSPTNVFDYTVTTPMRAIGSIALILGTRGLISADYEYVNYPEARLSSTTDPFSDENDAIQIKYRSQRNIRLGGELRLDPLTLRAGYALYGSPYHTNINDGERQSISFGFGFRDEDYFLDFAYVMSVQKEDYYLYNSADIEPATIKSLNNGFMFTLGFKY